MSENVLSFPNACDFAEKQKMDKRKFKATESLS